jgi:hypothetical protein
MRVVKRWDWDQFPVIPARCGFWAENFPNIREFPEYLGISQNISQINDIFLGKMRILYFFCWLYKKKQTGKS